MATIMDWGRMDRKYEEGFPFTWNHSIRVVLRCADGVDRTFRRFFVYDLGYFVGTYCMSEEV